MIKTFTVEGWLDGVLIAEECSVELFALSDMVSTLEEEGFEVCVRAE